jgi:hypothetical protein
MILITKGKCTKRPKRTRCLSFVLFAPQTARTLIIGGPSQARLTGKANRNVLDHREEERNEVGGQG